MRTCPYCAAPLEATDREGNVRPECSVCEFRQYANPVPATNAAIVRDGHVVLIRRGLDPYAGQWALPGGFVEWDEEPADTTVREAKEETGLDVRLTGHGVFLLAQDDPRTNVVCATYPAEPVEPGLPEPVGCDDAAEAAWVRLDALPRLAFENQERALVQLGFVSGEDLVV